MMVYGCGTVAQSGNTTKTTTEDRPELHVGRAIAALGWHAVKHDKTSVRDAVKTALASLNLYALVQDNDDNSQVEIPIHDDNITPQVAIAIGIFILPPYGQIPLHGHPEMTVLSKLLYGDVQLRSYQMLDTKIHSSSGTIRTFKQESSNSSILAKLSQDVIKQSGDVWGLYPDRNNVRLIQ